MFQNGSSPVGVATQSVGLLSGGEVASLTVSPADNLFAQTVFSLWSASTTTTFKWMRRPCTIHTIVRVAGGLRDGCVPRGACRPSGDGRSRSGGHGSPSPAPAGAGVVEAWAAADRAEGALAIRVLLGTYIQCDGGKGLEHRGTLRAAWKTYLAKKDAWRTRWIRSTNAPALHLSMFPMLLCFGGTRGLTMTEFNGLRTLQLRMTRRVCGWWPRTGDWYPEFARRAARLAKTAGKRQKCRHVGPRQQQLSGGDGQAT